MSVAQSLVNFIDAVSDRVGRAIAWLILAMALLTAGIVVLRYGFNVGSILAQEMVVYLHGAVFLLGAAYALKTGAHVRVDVFYRNFQPRTKAWVDSIGGIVFLLPLCAFIIVSSWDYVSESWRMQEISAEPGGIPAVFILKSLIPVAAANLALQGIAEVLRSALRLTTDGSD